MPDTSSMIQLDHVSKSFRVAPGPRRKAGVVEAIRAVTAHIDGGGITGVVGPNGAGKSTLFALLLGFLEPTDGAIRIDGQAPRSYTRRHGASYVPERFQLPRDWTVRAALRALLDLDGATQSIAELLVDFELEEFADAKVHTLSRGTLQRVGIAQAVAVPRRLVVFDEPTEGLDPIWRVRFRERLARLRSDTRAILIASHDLAEIERIADRVIILQRGTITETVDVRARAQQPRDYTLALARPHDAITTFFSGARATGEATYAISVADAADLSARLAALIAAGGSIVSVQPAASLEERVVQSQTDPA